jgi:hypothetical protein
MPWFFNRAGAVANARRRILQFALQCNCSSWSKRLLKKAFSKKTTLRIIGAFAGFVVDKDLFNRL